MLILYTMSFPASPTILLWWWMMHHPSHRQFIKVTTSSRGTIPILLKTWTSTKWKMGETYQDKHSRTCSSLYNENQTFQVTSNITQNHTRNWSSLHTMLLLSELEPNWFTSACWMVIWACNLTVCWNDTMWLTNHYQLCMQVCCPHPTPTRQFRTTLLSLCTTILPLSNSQG